ncbi:3-hydroxybutyrate dehydrogenase [Dactylosporangium sp. NPDC051484]|uniref:3-hydroxybutyrate dehydrogenase n=1 Tax=Dactylosporangium sp. NPDC051484 TaxID=3154942 RepID=UPI00344C7065
MTTPHPATPHQVVALDLRGRTALVTGAGSGIGRSVAVRLATAGARVVALDRDAEPLEALAREADVIPVVADLSDLDGIEQRLAGHLDVDVLVNNAGLQHVAALEDFPPERFAHIQTVMVCAPFRLVRAVLPHMYAGNWGRVVNISSVHGLRASPFKAAYVTAKHALEGLSKTVALEGAPHGVTANCVNPAYVRTPLVEKQIADQARTHGIDESEVVEKIMLTSAAIKRLIEPAEVAELVAYLCTDVAGFITGTSLSIDGGWTAH